MTSDLATAEERNYHTTTGRYDSATEPCEVKGPIETSMFSIGDIVVQRGGRDAGRVGAVVAIAHSGHVLARDASGRTFRCQRGNVRTVLDMLKSATAALSHAARAGTQLQFFAAMVEWTRLAQLCIGLGLHADAVRVFRQTR